MDSLGATASTTRTASALSHHRRGEAEPAATLATPVGARTSRRTEPLAIAYAFLVLFLIVYCARPEDWVPGLAVIPLAKTTGLLALVAFVLSVGLSQRGISRLPRELVYMVLLFGQLCLAVVFSPIWRGGAFDVVVYGFSKVVLISFVIALTVRTLGRLRRLLFVQAASVAVIVLVCIWKFSIYGRSGRLTSALYGIYNNPNELAFAIALVFPFCFLFFLRTRSQLGKILWALVMLELTYGVFLTFSRGGLLALLAAAAICVWEFGVRGRRHHLAFLTGLVALGILLIAIPAHYGERVDTIFNPDADATGSAQARQYLLRRSIAVTIQNPFFGVGPGNFGILSGIWRDTHNTYTQLSAEAGLPALILFLMLLMRTFSDIRRAKQLARRDAEAQLVAGALRASLAAFIVGSFFANVAYHFFPYFLMGYATALHGITETTNASAVEPDQVNQAVNLRFAPR